mmetsp:Transcript_9735/g.24204  ORF Transcript_9735/g.24204 Transcript_9735/m.24204 type:complete len:200 (-) Transcript_9735:235-834(-)
MAASILSIICVVSLLSTMMARLALPFHALSAMGAYAVSADVASAPVGTRPSATASDGRSSHTTQPWRSASTSASSCGSVMGTRLTPWCATALAAGCCSPPAAPAPASWLLSCSLLGMSSTRSLSSVRKSAWPSVTRWRVMKGSMSGRPSCAMRYEHADDASVASPSFISCRSNTLSPMAMTLSCSRSSATSSSSSGRDT